VKSRVVGLVVGIIYAVGYGFFTALATGGGHGNFLWLMAFFITFFVGLFFPAAGFLVSDLSKFWARVSLLTLLSLNVAATFMMFWSLTPEEEWKDFAKSWDRSAGVFVFMTAIHCAPLICLWCIALWKVWVNDWKNIP
jgi:hypothetical protein